MNIAIISSGFFPVVDGVTVSLYHRLRSLSQHHHQVLVLCPDYQSLASIYPQWQQWSGEILPGVRVVNLPSEPFMGVDFERNLSRAATPLIQTELTAFQPDIVHVDEPDRIFLGTLNAPGVAYAKRYGVPCVGFYHTNFVDYIEDFFPLPRPIVRLMQWGATQIIRRVFHSYDATLVSNPVAQQRVQQLGIGNTVCDRLLGVDLTPFQQQSQDPQFFQHHYGLPGLDNKVILLFLGRLTPDKGWRFTLEALTHFAQTGADWLEQVAIVVAGDGELQADIQQRLQTLGLTFALLGRIAPDAVPPLLTHADIHVTTSEKETLGLTLLEAFAAGKPVVAPRAGGVVHLIRDGENGLLFDPKDVEGLGRSLHTLVTHADLRQKLGQQGQEDATAYSWDAAVHTLLKTWHTQLSGVNK